ncbi:MAG TPA: cytochrome P450 [Leptolyngbyaceae cyanobacterium]
MPLFMPAEIAFTTLSLYLGLITSLIAILGVLGWRYWKKKRHYQPLRTIPSPPGHWLLGNIPQVLEAVKKKQFFQLIFDWSQQYGSTYVYWAGEPVLVLSKPSAIESTLINGVRDGSLIRTPSVNIAWNDISGPILLGQSGEEWQWRRKAWNPEFTLTGLSAYQVVVDQACTQITDKIRTAAPSEVIQVDALFVELTMRVIACLLLGIPIDSKIPSPEGPPLDIPKLYEAMSVFGYRFLRVATGEKLWAKYLPTQSSREYWSARRYLEQFLSSRVDLALRLRDRTLEEADLVSDLFQNSMLVKIAAKEPRYTKEFLIAETVELLIAGTDTTAHTLSFAVGELALHPDVFQKAQAIVDQTWQAHGSLSIESLKELNYLRAIVKETLRLYSIASGSTSLTAIKPTVVDGIDTPAGTRVYWSILGAGRDAETYAQPERFWPERWLEEGKGSLSLPVIGFGSGAHRCLGEHLAMLEATIMLAQLLRHFEWDLVNGRSSLENLQQNLLIYPPDGMPLRFRAREAVRVGV